MLEAVPLPLLVASSFRFSLKKRLEFFVLNLLWTLMTGLSGGANGWTGVGPTKNRNDQVE